MQDRWYADNRDLAKWGVLVHLARKQQNAKILQVACYRRSETGTASLACREGGEPPREVPLPQEVYEHFRDVRHITRLQDRTGLTVEVFNEEFRHPREGYFKSVVERVKRDRHGRLLVFLDPDTGIAPKRATLEHVTDDELKRIYGVMHEGDLLVLYQHARRRKEWEKETSSQFARALDVPEDWVAMFTCLEVASDVALFAVQKQARSTDTSGPASPWWKRVEALGRDEMTRLDPEHGGNKHLARICKARASAHEQCKGPEFVLGRLWD